MLVTEPGMASQDANLSKVLCFFGVSRRALTLAEFLNVEGTSPESSSKCRLICSSGAFLRLMEESEPGSEGARRWRRNVHSAFVYAGDDPESLQQLLSRLQGDGQASLLPTDRAAGEWAVSNDFPEFCGPLSGLRTLPTENAVEVGLVFDEANANTTSLISNQHGAAFVKIDYQTVPVFFSISGKIVDIDSELTTRNFDIRKDFLSAVPIVLYVKWAFPETCWKAPEVNACLVIDDPLLKPRYGFLTFWELLNLMANHNFSTSIAFIPWNWRRSATDVVRLFKENPERYSLSVHGCDHTAGEFGTSDTGLLASKARKAVERMSRHESETGLQYDRIMVFPQGVFSKAAMGILKRSNFTAAVNTEVISADPHPPTLRIRDVWNVAVMNYDSLPIFTRRYPSQGIENFAFDILLGKPCIIVIHHDFCRNQYAALVEFVKRVNALNCPLSWRSLGELVKRSCRQRELSQEGVEIEMYGTELRIENLSEQRKRFSITKRETDPSAIKEIRAGSQEIAWKESGDQIFFEIELDPGQNRTVGMEFHDISVNENGRESLSYKVKTMLRRYLSEVRDNYVKTSKTLSRLSRLRS